MHLRTAGLSWVLALGLGGCTTPPPTSPQAPAEAGDSRQGVLTRKGNAPFLWWALQTDSGEVWQLELPDAEAEQALLPRQNCRVLARGRVTGGLKGAGLLQLQQMQNVPDPGLGSHENQRCSLMYPGPRKGGPGQKP